MANIVDPDQGPRLGVEHLLKHLLEFLWYSFTMEENVLSSVITWYVQEFFPIYFYHERLVPALVAQLDVASDWIPGGCGFNPHRGRQHSFVEIDHEIVSTVILSLLLIQEGQLSVSGKRMCTILVNRLED